MELRQIECFLAIADHRGIAGAARALKLAQPTVSQALRSLERELDVQLYHRVGRGMVLSSAGRALIGPARGLLRTVTEVENRFSVADGEPTGRLDIEVFPSLADGPILDLIAEFRRRYPRVVIRFGELHDETQAAARIEDGHCEFVVAHTPVTGTELDLVGLGVQEFWLAFPPGSTVPPEPIRLDSLPAIPMIFVPRGQPVADEIENAILSRGNTPTVAVQSAHREARLPMVTAGIGATLLERSAAQAAELSSVVVRRTEPKLERPFAMAYDSALLSPVGKAFLALAIDTIGTTADG